MTGERERGRAGEDVSPALPLSRSPLVAVYADESCLGNGRDGENPGGAGALIEFLTAQASLIRRDLWTSAPATTNNRMALQSVIETFRAISAKGRRFRVVFTTDSRYIVDGMNSWVHAWAARGWKRKAGEVENLPLWGEAVRLASPHAVQWRWVRGHVGHAQNEYANHLAVRAAGSQDRSDGLIPSEFDTWITTAGKLGGRVDPFPSVDDFLAARTLPVPPLDV